MLTFFSSCLEVSRYNPAMSEREESERGSDKKEDSLEERAGKRARTTVGGNGGDEKKEGVANADGDDAYESPEAWAGANQHTPLYFSRVVFPNKGISHCKITRMHARGISFSFEGIEGAH